MRIGTPWLALAALAALGCGGRSESGFYVSDDESEVLTDVSGTTTDVHTEGGMDVLGGSNGASGDSSSSGTAGGTGGTHSPEGSSSSGGEPEVGHATTGGDGNHSGLPTGELPACEGSCSGCDPDLGFCYIQCVGDRTCIQAELTCPEGWPCVVLCKGTSACIQAEVTCPSNERCSLECSGDSACIQLALGCQGDLCQLSCSGASSCSQLRRE